MQHELDDEHFLACIPLRRRMQNSTHCLQNSIQNRDNFLHFIFLLSEFDLQKLEMTIVSSCMWTQNCRCTDLRMETKEFLYNPLSFHITITRFPILPQKLRLWLVRPFAGCIYLDVVSNFSLAAHTYGGLPRMCAISY